MQNSAEHEYPRCLPPIRNPLPPRHSLPRGATDCHCHVYEDPRRYALSANRSYTPAVVTLEEYREFVDAMGIDRMVQVSASVYGFDNSMTLDTIAALGLHRARGIAGLPADAPPAELERLHAGGIRGVRLSTGLKGYSGVGAIDLLAARIRPYGWHLQVHVPHVDELVALEEALLRAPIPLVFDHMGMVRGGEGVGNPGFQALLRLLRRRDDCWTKISAWYRGSDSGDASCSDMRPIVEALVDARPDRLVFGTNWPHPRLFSQEQVPDDSALIDQFCDWVADPAVRNRILVDNPAALYGFTS